ncbi:WSC domain-containing protein [Apiosordaria backusii]|uniref:WSC domain-containing protein n=1 Tax=Apiosordaria backusii TaxID=314023 RepID=A0AA40ANB9_9PEZI|nr:WSC domain-containing protein [Apiosordaria backusii]
MSSTRSSSGLRAASLFCLIAASHAIPHGQVFRRQDTSSTRNGCFISNVNGQRLLSSATYASDAMTVESCAAFCFRHKYFALEYGRECYCGNSYSAEPVSNAQCSFPCAGNPAQKCGAGNRVDLYTNGLYVPRAPATLDTPYLGCFVDEGPRVLPDNLLGADDMAAEKCAAHCANYSYFGVEYGRECWCGNSRPKNSAPETECSFPCAGNDSQLCGAGGRINVWGSPLPSPETVGDFEYAGCFTDAVGQRSLRGKTTYDSAMALEKCAASCSGYDYFGVSFREECYCGNVLEPTAVEVPQAECAMRCAGNYSQVCGDANRLNVFSNAQCLQEPESPLSVGGFNYQACWTDQVGARSLADVVERSDNMTVEACAAICEDFNFFGVEFGRECFCGNVLGGEIAPESDCTYRCAGASNQLCGAVDRLNLYAAVVPTTTEVVVAPTPVPTLPAEDDEDEEPTLTTETPTPTPTLPAEDEEDDEPTPVSTAVDADPTDTDVEDEPPVETDVEDEEDVPTPTPA